MNRTHSAVGLIGAALAVAALNPIPYQDHQAVRAGDGARFPLPETGCKDESLCTSPDCQCPAEGPWQCWRPAAQAQPERVMPEPPMNRQRRRKLARETTKAERLAVTEARQAEQRKRSRRLS